MTHNHPSPPTSPLALSTEMPQITWSTLSFCSPQPVCLFRSHLHLWLQIYLLPFFLSLYFLLSWSVFNNALRSYESRTPYVEGETSTGSRALALWLCNYSFCVKTSDWFFLNLNKLFPLLSYNNSSILSKIILFFFCHLKMLSIS